jgi:hypothetical protein
MQIDNNVVNETNEVGIILYLTEDEKHGLVCYEPCALLQNAISQKNSDDEIKNNKSIFRKISVQDLNFLPETLESLCVRIEYFNLIMDMKNLPTSLKYLDIESFKGKLYDDDLPPNLKKLSINDFFGDRNDVKLSIPKKIELMINNYNGYDSINTKLHMLQKIRKISGDFRGISCMMDVNLMNLFLKTQMANIYFNDK